MLTLLFLLVPSWCPKIMRRQVQYLDVSDLILAISMLINDNMNSIMYINILLMYLD